MGGRGLGGLVRGRGLGGLVGGRGLGGLVGDEVWGLTDQWGM